MNTTPKSPSVPNASTPGGSGAFKGEFHRRPDIPNTPNAPNAPNTRRVGADSLGSEPRKLLIGREIVLSGEISSCDVILVEGTVEAKLRESRHMDVAESGAFKGTAEVDDADIAGRFEGDLIVHGRLRVRATGRIEGRIHYGELEVESGGQLIGDIHAAPPNPSAGALRTSPAAAPITEPSRLSAFPSVPPASVASRNAGQETPTLE